MYRDEELNMCKIKDQNPGNFRKRKILLYKSSTEMKVILKLVTVWQNLAAADHKTEIIRRKYERKCTDEKSSLLRYKNN